MVDDHNDISRWKVKSWEKIYHANINQRKAGLAILISDRVQSKGNCQGQKNHTT